MPQSYGVITRRADFLAAGKSGCKCATSSLIAQARRRAAGEAQGVIRVGVTATKALGKAVVRNRVKRRLREAARALIPDLAVAGCDYVFIGRSAAHRGSFDGLIRDMKHALKRLSEMLSDPNAR